MRTLKFYAIPLSALAYTLVPVAVPAQTTSNVVISQVFGGGGNAGATVNADYIELFNQGSTTAVLQNYALQYGSATGTTTFLVGALPATVTLATGQFYLVQGAAGTAGAALGVTPDATVSLNLSGTAGKIALVSSKTALTGACPLPNAAVLDLVGYGAANCSEGGTTAPTLSSMLAAVRHNVCVNTNNNGADFGTVTAGTAVHNSASTPQPCSTIGFSATGAASPSSVAPGGSTLLTVSPSPVANGTTVAADLTPIGGLAGQAFYDDGSHGDVTAGDGVFSYLAPVSSGTAVGPVQIVATATNASSAIATATIALTVTAPVTETMIHTLQGENPAQSPYVGQTVTTSGIVTGVGTSGFFLEEADQEADNDPLTPEGIYVYTGSTKASASVVAVGNRVQVTGKLAEYPNPSNSPGAEIDSPMYTLVSTGNALPTPVQLSTTDASTTGTDAQLEKYQSMLVAVPAMVSTGPTDANLTETTETNVSNGQFYAVVQGIGRPFLMPGINVNETLPAGSPADIPRFDDNPERILVDSKYLGGTPINVTSNTPLTGVQGIVDYSSGYEKIDLSPTAAPMVGEQMTAVAVPAQSASEFTIATFNMERFYDPQAETAGATAITQAAYTRRLMKASNAIRNVLKMPDIVGVEEQENIETLTAVANQVSTDAQTAGQLDPKYQPFVQSGNDPSGINVGLLVKSSVVVKDVTQFGKDATYTNPANGQATELNDRPPLVLHALVGGGSYGQEPVTVVVNHLRSLIDGDDTGATGATVRAKREAQAEYLANLIQGYQKNGEHVVSVGDFNAFQFSDGYVDTLGAVRGNPAPADQVVVASPANLVSPNLTDLESLVTPVAQQYSYVETGNAQTLDHILVTQDLVAGAHQSYGRMDADFPLVDLNDATTPLRSSDHDPAVAYFPLSPVTTTLHLSSASIEAGQTLQYAATVDTGGGTAATGSVTFADNQATLQTVQLANGTYSGSTQQLTTPGTYSITTHYGGDSTYSAEDAQPVKLTVRSFPFTLQLVGTGDPQSATIKAGSSVQYRVMIGDGAGPTLHGQLAFYASVGTGSLQLIGGVSVDGTQLKNGNELDGSYPLGNAGMYTVYATYINDANYAGTYTQVPVMINVQ